MILRSLFLAASVVAGIFFAQSANAATGYTTVALNLRTCASASCPRITTIPAGARVWIHSCDGWCDLTYAGRRGFAHGKYIVAGVYAPAPPRVYITPPRIYRPIVPPRRWHHPTRPPRTHDRRRSRPHGDRPPRTHNRLRSRPRVNQPARPPQQALPQQFLKQRATPNNRLRRQQPPQRLFPRPNGPCDPRRQVCP